jgi:hypothetical protein
VRYGLEVVGIHAGANPTQMIQLEARRDVADEQAVARCMRLDGSTVEDKAPVARRRMYVRRPQPAGRAQYERTVEVDLRQQSL